MTSRRERAGGLGLGRKGADSNSPGSASDTHLELSSYSSNMSSRAPLLTPSNLRLDSRLPLELRSLSFQILPSPPSSASSSAPSLPPAGADGYALVSHGLTRASSSVFGPREQSRTGAFSGGGQQGGAKAGDKATVNVEVGVAGWTERSAQGTAGGVKKGGKDR